jgi:hypothetical protein
MYSMVLFPLPTDICQQGICLGKKPPLPQTDTQNPVGKKRGRPTLLYHLRQRGWLRPPPERLVNRTTVNSVLGNPVLWTWVETGSYARSLGYCQYIPWSRRSFPDCMCLPSDFLSLSSTCFAPAHRCSARADKTAASGRKRQRTRSILTILES